MLRKGVDHLLDQDIWRRGAGGDADGLDPIQCAPVDIFGALHQLRIAASGARGDFNQTLGIGRIGRPNHQKRIAERGNGLDRFLAICGGVTDIFFMWPGDIWEAALQGRDNPGCIIDR